MSIRGQIDGDLHVSRQSVSYSMIFLIFSNIARINRRFNCIFEYFEYSIRMKGSIL